MYRLLFVLFCASWTTFLQGQNTSDTTIDPRLREAFDEPYLENLKNNQPSVYARLVFYLDHAYYITEYPEEKGPADFPEIEIENMDRINIFLLERTFNLQRDHHKQTYYKVAGTDQVLVFHAGKRFTRLFNEHLGRTYPERTD
jgi:hypothetical protein